MRVVFFISLLLFCLKTFSQSIHIQVIDELNDPVALALVQLLKDNKAISYGQSDKNGTLTLDTKGYLTALRLSAAHLSYQTKSITVDNADSIVIQLEPKYNQIQEITIASDNYDVTRSKDTVGYKLHKLLNGSETLVKDALTKLPGITIDQNKKILYQGKMIDHLLIDGAPFYGDNHQLATEHLKANILQGVEVLTNYNDKGSLGDFTTSKTAVNLQIKQEFKNKNNLDLLGQGDFSTHYQGQANLYAFHPKSKISFIADINNINQSLFTPKDYTAVLNKSGKALLNQSRASFFNTIKTPEFLNSDKDAKVKSHQGLALNYSKEYTPSSSLEIQGFTSYLKQEKQQEILQRYYLPENPQTLSLQKANQNARFTSLYANYLNQKNDNFSWSLATYYLGSKLMDISDFKQTTLGANNTKTINQNSSNYDHSFGVNALLKYNFTPKTQGQLLLFSDFRYLNSDLDLLSNTPLFLPEKDQLSLNQTTTKDLISTGMKASLKHKLKNAQITLEATVLNDFQKGNNINNLPASSKDKLNKNYYTFGAYFNQKLFKNKLTVDLGADYVLNQNTLSHRENTRFSTFLPYVKTSLQYQDFSLNLEVKRNLKSPDIDAFFQSDILQDYQSILLGSTLNFKNIYAQSLQGNLSYGNPLKNTFALVALTYSKGKDILGTSSEIQNNISTSYYNYLDFEKSSTFLALLQKKSRKLPLGGNLQVFYAQTQNTSKINALDALTKTTLSKYDLFIQSYFKQSYFNVKTGVVFQGVKSTNQTKTGSTLTNYTHIEPQVKLFGQILRDKVLWEFKYGYNYYKTTNLKQDQFSDIDLKFTYKIKPYFDVFLSGSNLLSLNKNYLRQSLNTQNNYIQQRSLMMLQGYLNLGANFTF